MGMTVWKTIVSLMLTSLVLSACSLCKQPHFFNTYSTITPVDLKGFHHIVSSGQYPVEIYSVPEGQDHIVVLSETASATQNVGLSVTHDTLMLSSTRMADLPSVKRLVKVYVSDLRSIRLAGASDIQGFQLKTDQLSLINDGTGQINIAGSAVGLKQVSVYSSGGITVSGVNGGGALIETAKDSTGNITLSGAHVSVKTILADGSGVINISGLNGLVPMTLRAHAPTAINLSGHVNLTYVEQAGSGDINIDGLQTQHLDILDSGTGSLNFLGKDIHLMSLVHTGKGAVNIYNIHSPRLCIVASGSGTIKLVGQANLHSLVSTGSSHISLSWLLSDKTNISVSGTSETQLAGLASELTIHASQHAILSGRELRGETIYLQTQQNSRVGIWPKGRLYSKALDHSSIYYYHEPSFLSKYNADFATVLPIK